MSNQVQGSFCREAGSFGAPKMGGVWHELRSWLRYPGLVQVLTFDTTGRSRSSNVPFNSRSLDPLHKPTTHEPRKWQSVRGRSAPLQLRKRSRVFHSHIGAPRHALRTKLGLRGRCGGMSSQREVSAARNRERLSCVFPPLASIQRVLDLGSGSF